MGNKNSGRRPMRDLDIRRAVIDKAWKVAQQALEGQMTDLANKDKLGTAQAIVVKDMVGKESVDMQATITQEERTILDKYIHSNRIAN